MATPIISVILGKNSIQEDLTKLRRDGRRTVPTRLLSAKMAFLKLVVRIDMSYSRHMDKMTF